MLYLEGNEIKGFISIINKEFIGTLFVDVNSQGNGTGSKLIERVKEIYDYLELSVYKDNKASVCFYNKVGFTLIREEINEETNKVECIMSYNNK
jgi:putative acetyltransferase